MSDSKREQLVIRPLEGYDPEVARWLWALEDTRQRTKRTLADLNPVIVDWTRSPEHASVGSLLYHLAAIEADWLHSDILERSFPPEVESLFPYDVRDDRGRLTQITGLALEQHVQRLNAVRAIFLTSLHRLTTDEFHRVRYLSEYDVTPAYVTHHLMQHEAEHRGEIAALRAEAERTLKLK